MVCEAGWPTTAETATFEHLPDGTVRLTSIDDYASVSLSPSRQLFTLRFLCRSTQCKYSADVLNLADS